MCLCLCIGEFMVAYLQSSACPNLSFSRGAAVRQGRTLIPQTIMGDGGVVKDAEPPGRTIYNETALDVRVMVEGRGWLSWDVVGR